MMRIAHANPVACLSQPLLQQCTGEEVFLINHDIPRRGHFRKIEPPNAMQMSSAHPACFN